MTNPFAWPVLSLLLGAPVAGTLGVWVLGEARPGLRRSIAGLASGLSLLVAGWLHFTSGAGSAIRELRTWVAPLGLSYDLVLEGAGFPLVVFIALAATLALLSEPAAKLPRNTAAAVLLVESSLLGLSMAADAVLFLAFFGLGVTALTLSLAPRRAMQSFFFFQSAGLSLATGLTLVFFHVTSVQTGFPSAEIARFSSLAVYPDFESGIFLLGAASFAFLAPLVPFTSWVRESVEALSTPVRAVLLGGWSLAGALLLTRLVPATGGEGAWLAAVAAASTLYAGLVPTRPGERSWAPLLVGFQGLFLLVLLTVGASFAMRTMLFFSSFLAALALGTAGNPAPAPTRASRLVAAGALLLLAGLLAPSGLALLPELWGQAPVVAVLAAIGSVAMVVRLLRSFAGISRAAASDGRRKLLLILPIVGFWILLAASPDRFPPAPGVLHDQTLEEEE